MLGVGIGVAVAVGAGVTVGVMIRVGRGVGVAISARVGLGVAVGEGGNSVASGLGVVPSLPQATKVPSRMTKPKDARQIHHHPNT